LAKKLGNSEHLADFGELIIVFFDVMGNFRSENGSENGFESFSCFFHQNVQNHQNHKKTSPMRLVTHSQSLGEEIF
jgi:hypothetical protein